MSGLVDVQAVMDAAAEALHESDWTARAHKLNKARVAVAELIEAAEQVSRIQIARPNDMGRAKQSRLRAALSRVGGAS